MVAKARVILSASPLEQNRILGDTDLGEVAEAAPPTSDGSEGKPLMMAAAATQSCGSSSTGTSVVMDDDCHRVTGYGPQSTAAAVHAAGPSAVVSTICVQRYRRVCSHPLLIVRPNDDAVRGHRVRTASTAAAPAVRGRQRSAAADCAAEVQGGSGGSQMVKHNGFF